MRAIFSYIFLFYPCSCRNLFLSLNAFINLFFEIPHFAWVFLDLPWGVWWTDEQPYNPSHWQNKTGKNANCGKNGLDTCTTIYKWITCDDLVLCLDVGRFRRNASARRASNLERKLCEHSRSHGWIYTTEGAISTVERWGYSFFIYLFSACRTRKKHTEIIVSRWQLARHDSLVCGYLIFRGFEGTYLSCLIFSPREEKISTSADVASLVLSCLY